MALTGAEIQKFFSTVSPFKALPTVDLKRIAAHVQEKTFAKGVTIFNEGDSADSVWTLFQGRIQILKFTSEGRPFAIESLGSGELFGTLCRMGGNGRNYPCTAVAADHSVVLKLLDRVFLEYYDKSAGMVKGVCTLCSQRLKDVQDLRCVGQESVPVRIAAILTRLYQVHGNTLPFTKKEISELCGTTLETTFRTLSRFQKKSLVKSLRGQIVIEKPQDLQNIADNA